MALSTPIASVSLPPAEQADLRWKHDVFLSFRGVDTRTGITSQLYDELENRRIKTFKDDQELEVGMTISPSLLTAIEESRFAIVVLSPNYATSPWCLEELTKIFQCMEGKDTILPLFYGVDPSDVRHQKNGFQVAFTQHEQNLRQSKEKVKEWRVALNKVAHISGWESKNHKSDEELVQSIVQFVCSKVQPIDFESIMSTTGFEAFEATREAMDGVMKVLKDDKVTVIGVYGMGGVGKTTMVKHISAQAQKDGLFDHVIMGDVSQSPDLIKIQGTLADMLQLKFKKQSAPGRASELKERIIRGNKILIILDDIWNTIDLLSIGIPHLKHLRECNSKILFTTRRLTVCHAMESQAKIPLNVLSEEDSWNLFVKKAQNSFQESTDLYKVAKQVARECAGLPVALLAVAKALGDKDLDEWNRAAQRLKASQPANPEDDRAVFECIKLSYDYLGSDDAKSCFLLCCLFPEDEDIEIEDLIKYGFGKGLFQDASTLEEARGRAHSVVMHLKASSMLLDSRTDGCIRMHDVIRDTAMSIALSQYGHGFLVKAGCAQKNWPEGKHKGYSAISLMKNQIIELPEELVCPKLQILLLQSNYLSEIPENFLQSLNELRVLDLSKNKIVFLPPSFGLLTNLRALYLDDFRGIIDISVLGKLKKLEMFSMRRFRLKELPKEIGGLTNLRKLDLTDSYVDVVPSRVISKLHQLEELHMQCAFRDWGTEIEGGFFSFLFGQETNADFDELTGLSYLNVVKVCIFDAKCLPANVRLHPNWINFNICISSDQKRIEPYGGKPSLCFPYQHDSRALSLDTTIKTLPYWFINVVTEKVETLECKDCKGLSNMLVEYEHGRLHGLKYLYVEGYDNMEPLMNTTTLTWVPNEPVFEKLEELHLIHTLVKELSVGELPPGSLRSLKILIVKFSKISAALLPSSLLPRLENLETVKCEMMSEMEYVFGTEGLEPEQIVLTKLREIKLVHLEKLIKLSKGHAARHAMFHNLKSLEFLWCNKLKSLFTSDVAQCLFQMEDLTVSYCDNLERIIEESDLETVNNNKTIVFPELKNLVLKELPNLTGFYNSTGSATIECPSLQHLIVKWCPQFTTSASEFHSRTKSMPKSLQHRMLGGQGGGLVRKPLWSSNKA